MTGEMDSLRSPDKNVRIDTAVAIGTGGDTAHVEDLVAALAVEHDFFVRETLVWALVRMGAPAVQPLVGLLRGGTDGAQRAAVQVLGKLGEPAAVPALLEALPAAEPAVRDRIVFSLGQIGDPATLPALVDLLGTSEGEAASTLAASIEGFGEDAFDVVVARSADPDAEVRGQVVDLLGFMESPRSIAPLAQAAADRHADVRVRALTALASTLPAVADRVSDAERARAGDALRRAADDPDRRVQLLARRLLADGAQPTTSST